MSATNVEIKRGFDGIISALQAIRRPYDVRGVENLPPVFAEADKWIPRVQKVFEACEKHLSPDIMDEESLKAVSFATNACRGKANRLDEIMRSSDTEEQYQRIVKGGQLEDLMKAILHLAKSPPFAVVARTQVRSLEEAIRPFIPISASLPEDGPLDSFRNYGSGCMNVNTGNGPQNNNNGPGYQFNGTVRSFQASK